MVLVAQMPQAIEPTQEGITLREFDTKARIQFTERELLYMLAVLEGCQSNDPAFFSLISKLHAAMGRIISAKTAN
jgi:hypothetical protein